MGQEFFVKSDTLEDKVRQILPSQGGLGQGFDLSASTQIVPIVDLTESAEGSNLRADLQSAISFDSASAYNISNASTTLISNTGYYRVFGIFCTATVSGANKSGVFDLSDGSTTKRIINFRAYANSNTQNVVVPYDFNVFMNAGDSLIAVVDADAALIGATRQLATINKELIDP